MSDQKLLKTIIKNPEAGIDAALRTYGGLVNAIARRVLGTRQEDVEECVFDTFVKLWKRAAHLMEQQVPLRGFLAVTARNTAIDRYRQLQKRMELPFEEDMPQEPEYLCAADSEEYGELLLMIQSLSPPDPEIFIRKYFFCESSQEIALRLGMSEQNVNLRLSRGRKKLKQQLLSEGEYYASK